jgi:hypothetical protein
MLVCSLNEMQQSQKQWHQKHQQLVTNLPPLLDRQIDEITKGISQAFNKSLHMLSTDNIKTIINYITATNTEIRLSTSYRKDIIQLLTKFARFHANNSVAKHDFNFKEVTRNDVINFLNSLRKTDEEDPLHKWIGTYNIYRVHLLRFFKWLHTPDIEPSKLPKPAVVDNIPKLHRNKDITPILLTGALASSYIISLLVCSSTY